MAEQLKRKFGLLALRIAMDLSGDSPQVNIQLQSHKDGRRDALAEWSVALDEIGLPAKLNRSRRLSANVSFRLPPSILAQIGAAFAACNHGDRPVWLHLAKPTGYLNLVPWEPLLQPTLAAPILRLPDFAAFPPRESPRSFDVALCGSTPAAKSQFTVADHLIGIAELLLSTVPRRTTVHIFSDSAWFDTVRTGVAERNLSDIIVHNPAHSPTSAQHERLSDAARGDDRVQNPWLLWMREALNGRSIDMVQFLTHGYLMRDSGALALAESPMRNRDQRTARFVYTSELLTFLTQSGAWCAAFSSPEQNYSEMGLRLLADTVAQLRPGPVLYHETRLDPHREALANVYRFLFARNHSPPPSSPALFTYCHPLLVEPKRFARPARSVKKARRSPKFSVGEPIFEALGAAADLPSWVSSSQRYIERRRQDADRILNAFDDQRNAVSRVENAQLIEDTLSQIEDEIANVLVRKNMGKD